MSEAAMDHVHAVHAASGELLRTNIVAPAGMAALSHTAMAGDQGAMVALLNYQLFV